MILDGVSWHEGVCGRVVLQSKMDRELGMELLCRG